MAMEEIKVSGSKLKAKLKELIKEGNVRRVVLRNPEGKTLLDMPLNAGFAGAALLPFWAAVGAVLFLAKDYTSASNVKRVRVSRTPHQRRRLCENQKNPDSSSAKVMHTMTG